MQSFMKGMHKDVFQPVIGGAVHRVQSRPLGPEFFFEGHIYSHSCRTKRRNKIAIFFGCTPVALALQVKPAQRVSHITLERGYDYVQKLSTVLWLEDQ